MIYRIELKDLSDGWTENVEVSADMRLSEFADLIRREMEMPFNEDVQYRKTYCNGHIYMKGSIICDYVDALWEGADDPYDLEKKGDRYKESTYLDEKSVRLSQLFTSIGSAFRFTQGRDSVSCSLTARK